MAMEEGLDTGPVLLEERLEIGPLENAQRLAGRLANLTAQLMVRALPRLSAAGAGPLAERWARLGLRSQPEEGITYARLLTRDDYVLHWERHALELHRRVMGLYPGAHTLWRGRRLKVLATEPIVAGGDGGWTATGGMAPWACRLAEGRSPAPGEVMAIEQGRGLVVACGEGALLLGEAQLEGKTPCQGSALLQQLGARPGDSLGDMAA
jgi:methionyl-tRNA formyltransferase